MKKLILIFAVIFSFTAITSKAEDIDVKWGTEMKDPGGAFKVVGKDANSYYIMRTIKKRIVFEKYKNSTNSLEATKDIMLPADKKKARYFDSFFIGGKVVLFFSHLDKKVDKNSLYAISISTSGSASKPKLVDQILNAKRAGKSGSFDTNISDDKSKLLVTHLPVREKGQKQKFSYKVFDKNLTKLWGKDLSFPYADELYSIENYTLDNAGNLMMLAYIFKDKKAKRYREAKVELNIIDSKTKEVKKLKLSLGDKYFSDMGMKIGPKGNLYIGGFYSEYRKGYKGSFLLKINPKTKAVVSKSLKPFSEEFYKSFFAHKSEKKQAKKGSKAEDRGLYGYAVDYLDIAEDGSAFFIAEYRTIVTTTNSNGQTYTTYTYNDIIVNKINADGKIDWVKRVPKTQIKSQQHMQVAFVSIQVGRPADFYMSYSYFIKNNTVYLMFNDHPNNFQRLAENKRLANLPAVRNKMMVTLVKITPDGKISRKPMFQGKEVGTLFVPDASQNFDDGSMVLYGEKGSEAKFGKLVVK